MLVISVVIPMKNEERTLDRLLHGLQKLELPDAELEIVAVNDGSTDGTLSKLMEWQARWRSLVVIDLARNFGKEAALIAGLAYAGGAAIITMDADLQHPPELIPVLIEKWKTGAEVVLVIRSDRNYQSAPKRLLARMFYRIINKVSEVELPENVGDYRLLDRKVADAFLALPERNRFNKGLLAWLGFRTARVTSTFAAREDESRWQIQMLSKLALDGITSFSSLPLRIWSLLGLVVAAVALILGGYIVGLTLIHGVDVPGFPTIIVLILFFGGINMLALGVLGEYTARIFVECKARPLYVVRQVFRPPDERERDSLKQETASATP